MAKTREELALQDKWNVEALYSDRAEWDRELTVLKGEEANLRWPEIASYKGRLGDPKVAGSFFDFYFGIDRKLSKLYSYAHLKLDEDLGNDLAKKDYGMISNLYHDFQKECAWIEPELLSLKEADFAKLMFDPSLNAYRFFLEKIHRMKPHTLEEALEELMALSGKAMSAPSRAFSVLNNADLVFASAIDSAGKEQPLTHGSYLACMRSKDRNLRKSAFQNLHKAFEAHANTFCELLQGEVQKHVFHAKARKYPNCLTAALFPHKIDPVVYENLISSVRKAHPLLHQYIALRKQLLNLPELHYYDLMAPLVDEVQISMSYKEACEAVIQSVAPLGKDYQHHVEKGLLQERWVDVYETPKKRSGAYSSGCYDSMPYILLNYQGTLNDVLTLAHEMGHSMHSLLSRRNQPYIYSEYPIFVAEVASTFNEQLLLKKLKENAQSKKERAYLINYEIEGIRGTIFRQTFFAEFEWQIHKWVEEGTPLTPQLLKEFYVKLNRDYYGKDLVLDPELEIEWARIPHFYYNFYVYQYATGLSAALALFKKSEKDPKMHQEYLQFLSSGGSNYPIELLEQARVNMRTKEPIEAAMHHFKELLEELRECLSP